MATTYDVGIRWIGGPAAQQALRDADRVRSSLGALEAKPAKVGGRRGGGDPGRGIADEWQKMAAQAERAAQREQAAQLRMQAQAVRSVQQGETQKRNAAFRRLQQGQREEEQFTRYRISLDRKLLAEKQRSEQAMLRAELSRINKAQQAERQAAAAQQRARQSYINGGNGKAGGGMGLLGMVGMASAGGSAVAAGTYVGGQAVDTVKLIEGARMRLTASLGSTEAANQEIKDAFRIAEKTIFDPRQMVEAMSQLSTNFKALDMRRYVLGAISDFATVSGKGEEGMKSAIIAINQIVAKGKLQQEELTGQLGELGLPARKVYEQLAVILKVKGKDDQERTNKIIKMITAGEVGSDAAVQAITQVMRNQSGGGAAGSFALKNAGSLEGQISNLKSGFASLFAMAEIDKWPAIEKLKEGLGAVSGLFATDSKAGADLMSVLKFYANVVTTSFIVMGQAMTYPIRQAYLLFGVIRDAISDYNFTGLFDAGAWMRLGSNMIQGLVDGIKGGAQWVYDALGNLANEAVEILKRKLHINSPSRVMMQLGAYTGEGFARGIAGGTGRVTAASRMLGDAAAGGIQAGGGLTVVARDAAAGGGAGGNYTVNNYITLPIQAAGDAAELVRQAGPMLDAYLEASNDRYFGRLLAQGGS